MLKLLEPLWAKQIFISLYSAVQQSSFLYYWLPICADIFVFVYPVYLTGMYIWWIVYHNIYYKKASLWIFFATLISAIINIFWFQQFFEKERPNIFLNLKVQETGETILHQYLPASSFPSDHAVVSMSIAIASLLWGIKYKKKNFRIFGYIGIVISLIMCFSRIGIGIHWLTDILAWLCIGILVPLILFEKKIYTFLEKSIFLPLIKFQEKIIGR